MEQSSEIPILSEWWVGVGNQYLHCGEEAGLCSCCTLALLSTQPRRVPLNFTPAGSDSPAGNAGRSGKKEVEFTSIPPSLRQESRTLARVKVTRDGVSRSW